MLQPAKEYMLELGNEKMTVRTGQLANQANGSVVCQVGDTVVLGNCTVSAKAREGRRFPAAPSRVPGKFYAGGKIGGSRFRKREGRPSDDFVLMARVVDRGLAPMLPKHMRKDIQVFATVLSWDQEHEYDIIGQRRKPGCRLERLPV